MRRAAACSPTPQAMQGAAVLAVDIITMMGSIALAGVEDTAATAPPVLPRMALAERPMVPRQLPPVLAAAAGPCSRIPLAAMAAVPFKSPA